MSCFLAALATGALACSSIRLQADSLECPRIDLGESELDCPWASIARSGDLSVEALRDLRRQWSEDLKSRDLYTHWGRSINFDEAAKGIIVSPELLKQIGLALDIPVDSERIVHAGLEHTYGYLFSNLQTAYGFKRARWVSGEIDRGFGFDAPTISPTPSEGTLLANATALAVKLAWGESLSVASSRVQQLDPKTLRGRRLLEQVKLGKRTVALRTDLIEFPVAPIAKPEGVSPNSTLLVYSISDSQEKSPKIITLFPVQAGFAGGLFAPTKLGPNQEVSTRYNAFVEGLTGTPVKGMRTEVRWPTGSP